MEAFLTLQDIDQAADKIRSLIPITPKVGIILGSGLGALAEQVENPTTIEVANVPNWPVSTVMGHKGRLIIGMAAGQPVIVLQGRVHYYEGYSMSQVTMPVRVMKRLGVNILVVTNAAGAINPEYAPGDVMLITDHINFVGMGGANPLRGPNISELGERFPDMSQAYDRNFCQLARETAVQEGIPLREGVYVGLAGPSFETPADLRFLRAIGADAVGMSTVAEVTVARHAGMQVLGFSGLSNKANLDGSTITTHEEVLEAGKVITPQLIRVIWGVLSRLG